MRDDFASAHAFMSRIFLCPLQRFVANTFPDTLPDARCAIAMKNLEKRWESAPPLEERVRLCAWGGRGCWSHSGGDGTPILLCVAVGASPLAPSFYPLRRQTDVWMDQMVRGLEAVVATFFRVRGAHSAGAVLAWAAPRARQ